MTARDDCAQSGAWRQWYFYLLFIRPAISMAAAERRLELLATREMI
jgi:hypothetical protein